MSDRWTPTPEDCYVGCRVCAERNRPGSTHGARCGEGLPAGSGVVDPELANFLLIDKHARRWPPSLRALVDLRPRRYDPHPGERASGAVVGSGLVEPPEVTLIECPTCGEPHQEGPARCARCGSPLAP